MAQFPIAPINGEIATVANVAYQYNSSTNAWRRVIGNISTLSVSGNTTTGNLLTGGYVSATGNITGSYIIGNGSQLTGLPASYSNANVVAYGQAGWGGNIIPAANAVYSLGTAALQWKSLYVSNTTVYIGDVPLSTEGNVLTVAGNTVITATGSNLYVSGMISATGNIQGNYILGNGSQLSGLPATYSNANVSAYLPTYSGNLTAGNISATGNITGSYILGNGSQLSGLPATYSNANVAAYLPTYSGNLTAGNISATGNITGAYIIGNGSQLTGLPASYANSNAASYFASGNVTTNILTTALISATGNVTGSYIIGNGSTLSSITAGNVTGTVANATYATSAGTAGTVTTAAQPNITSVGTLTAVTATGNITGGNVLTDGLITATGNATAGNILTSGLISATGNVNGGNLGTAGTALISGAMSVVGATVFNNSGALADSIGSNKTTGTINIGSTGGTGTINIGQSSANQSLLLGTGGTTSGNTKTIQIGVSALANSTTTINIGPNSGTGGAGTLTVNNNTTVAIANTGSSALSVAGNVTGANILTAGLISAGSNVTAANFATAGLITATGNISTAGIINTANIYGSAGETIATGGNANINLYPGGTGNIVLPSGNATYINNLASPVNNSDAATKQYVDNLVTTAISYHQGVTAATTANLATTTSGTVTYTQPNGAGNGVGALLTTTGAFNLIDTANVQTVGTRILVKNEGNAVFNGVYTWANATNIVRSTDTDEYAPASPTSLSINDYFFVASGNVNAGSAWIVDSPSGTITFGTSNITFAQFSSSQTYSAGNGVSFAGTVVSARVDNVTTAFDGGGNISVKASATLTTPNIGAATGTSVSVTANVTGGNVLTAGIMSSTGNAIHGNLLTAGLVTATGNATAGNILTGGLVSATANITGGNVLTAGIMSSTGNAIHGNILTAGLISATSTITSAANIVGGNVTTVGLITATGNIQAGNIRTAGLISATGNVTGNYFVGNGSALTGITLSGAMTWTTQANTAPSNVAAGSYWYDSYSGVKYQYTNDGTGNVWVDQSFPTSFSTLAVTGNATIGGNLGVTGTLTYGNISTSGNVDGGNLRTTGLITATGNATAGNILTAGLMSATANITGGNILTAGLISATGNITVGGNLIIAGNITDTTQIDISTTASNANIVLTPNGTGNVNTPANVSVTGNVQGGNIRTVGLITATGNITGDNLSVGSGIINSGNINASNIAATGLLSVTGITTSTGYIMNAWNLGATDISATAIGGGSSASGRTLLGWNRSAGGGEFDIIVNADGGGAGGLSVYNWSNTLSNTTSLLFNINGVNGVVSAAGNIVGGNVSVGTGTVTLGNIVNANGNGVGNIGSSSLYFNTIFAKATSAQYADLAEMYVADQDLIPGTVVEFGGEYEIRASQISHSTAVAGIISTNPSYLMNAAQPGEHTVPVALTGRVPCRVTGTIHKGDRLVASDFAGVATVLDMTRYEPGCIIGKALENYDSNTVGVIEVAVGRT